MCGIVGELAFGHPPDDILKMMDVIVHRGPDDSGVYRDAHVHLGFRRLAIVDLSPAGHQPMSNEDGSIWLVFNGEIYNYLELRNELSRRGHMFRSQTDTETILHGYEEWGLECLSRLNGMFAFALWDSKREQLFCARDRFGVKPFYYVHDARTETFLLASEIKALLQHPATPRRPNERLIYDFLVAGLLDHTDQTCFAGISQLAPSHYMVVSRAGIVKRRYWDIPASEGRVTARPSALQRKRWVAELHDLLEDAVRLRLHADVPVGTCLSGGLDSSTIVCLANNLLFSDAADEPWYTRGERQKTFSACYDDVRHDERKYIEEVLACTGAEANYTFPGRDETLEELIPRIMWHQEEPFGSTSIVAQWHVMEAAASRGIKVLLDGQGADELFGGYHGFFGAALADDLLSRQAQQFVRDTHLYRRYHGPSWAQIGMSVIDGLLPPSSRPLRLLRESYRSRTVRTGILTHAFTQQHQVSDTWIGRPAGRLQTLMYNQATHTNLPALLHYEDRNSMASSIEARTPFLDYRIAEFLSGLPNSCRIEHGITKVILREAMQGTLPTAVQRRLDKKGFSTPEDVWFRTTLRPWVEGILDSSSLAERGYIDPGAMRATFGQHVAGTLNVSTLIWRVVSVELWSRMYLDSSAASAWSMARSFSAAPST